MSALHALVIAIAAVTLFLYGLQSFSREIQTLSDGPLRRTLALATKNRFTAALTGMVATAVLQSSSAVSSLAVALSDAGLLGLRAVLGVLIGSNVGTASTAFLVSFKIHGLGAYFIVLGSILSLLPLRARVIGKTLFYFGFILFALDLIGGAMEPFYQEPHVLEWLRWAERPYVGILLGVLFTALFQSSSVVTGMAVILADAGALQLTGAVAVVLGANIGTTSTALIASLAMKPLARAAAQANMIFNTIGVLLAYPFIRQLTELSWDLGESSTGLAVAFSHLTFNLGMAAFALLTMPWLKNHLLNRLAGAPEGLDD